MLAKWLRRLMSAFVTQAISDAFSVARRSLDVTITNDVCENSKCLILNAPARTRKNHPDRNNDVLRLLQIDLNDELLQSIEKMSVDQLVLVYCKFLYHLWKVCKEKTDGKVPLFMRNRFHSGCVVMLCFCTVLTMLLQSHVAMVFCLAKVYWKTRAKKLSAQPSSHTSYCMRHLLHPSFVGTFLMCYHPSANFPNNPASFIIRDI